MPRAIEILEPSPGQRMLAAVEPGLDQEHQFRSQRFDGFARPLNARGRDVDRAFTVFERQFDSMNRNAVVNVFGRRRLHSGRDNLELVPARVQRRQEPSGHDRDAANARPHIVRPDQHACHGQRAAATTAE